jgi:2-oxoglutarate ferredoxin oxidoreductase subunit beta
MFDYTPYLRMNRMPHIWCAGCGNGIVTKALIRAVDKLEIDRDEVVLVSGIGCSSRAPGYLNFNTLHTTHGRALAFSTGIKAFNPKLNVLIISGDGDSVAIGGNHFIHACRRNIDLTLVVFNNSIYGMTGGQNSPTTPVGSRTTSMPYGNIDEPFNIVELALGAGATFVARTTVAHPVQNELYIRKGIENKGFSVIEVVADCPTAYGRRNRMKDPVTQLLDYRSRAVKLDKAKKLSAEELQDKIITGIFRQETRPEFTDRYAALVKRLADQA